MLRVLGVGTFHLDQMWPGTTDKPWLSFVLYLVVFDFVDYWVHRGQHHFNWWWALHSLHHSQRQMTMWSDNRNHLLDDLLRDVILVVVGQAIGVGPGQFVAIVAIAQLSESLQHANLRLHFGRVGERLWISPRFHRLHHSVGIGHESGGNSAHLDRGRSPALGGHNFGVLFPWWDVLFRTGNFELRYDPTGVRDQLESGRNYGSGFWEQQWLGVRRLVGRASSFPWTKPTLWWRVRTTSSWTICTARARSASWSSRKSSSVDSQFARTFSVLRSVQDLGSCWRG
jgi:sterol desaturase/sphingolipid hydroxylase (fatty acid hydroxylase superfamily)